MTFGEAVDAAVKYHHVHHPKSDVFSAVVEPCGEGDFEVTVQALYFSRRLVYYVTANDVCLK